MASIIVLFIIIVVGVGVFWLMRRQGTRVRSRRLLRGKHAAHKSPDQAAPSRPGGLDKLQATGMFWGVEIGQPGCEAARELLGRQYPFAEAPKLPLEGCSSAVCTCQFKGLKERRTQHRRTHDDRRNEVRFEEGKTERRSPKNRRRGDSWNDHSY
jgi:hypothetical protein